MLRVLALGGLGEIGMNCMALEQRGEVLLVDCGVTFDERGLGIDVVHPDFAALDSLGTSIAGVAITHGHEDHIGALPYLLRKHDVPVHAPRYALGLIRERLDEHEVLAHARLFETRPREPYQIASFRIEPLRVTHSIVDATALAIRTDAGVVIHSGDFKFDEAPPDGESFDEARLRELGDEGVALLFSDSTGIDAEGPTGGEAGVGEVLEKLVCNSSGAVVVAMFASNVHRLRMLGSIARKAGRKILLLGRGVDTHARVARATGYLPWPDEIVWPEARARELPKHRVLGIATGSQGEERAALARLARGVHPALDLGHGDTVIVSARAIPGNEPDVHALLGLLLRRGVAIHTRGSDRGVHVSGHAHRPDQRRMLDLVRPRRFVPVHGTFHHLTRHAAMAREVGVPSVEVIENGQLLEVTADGLERRGTLPSGRVHVAFGREVPEGAIREREAMARDGVASCVVELDRGARVTHVGLSTRGVLDESAHRDELEEVKLAVRQALEEGSVPFDEEVFTERARLAIRRTFNKLRGSKPVTFVHLRRSA